MKPTQKLTETGITIIDGMKRILISVVSIYADEEVFLVKFLGNFALSCMESEQISLNVLTLLTMISILVQKPVP